jgi:hypothetical protein
VALLNVFLQWDQFFFNVLPEGRKPIFVVLYSTCLGQIFTYELQGDRACFLGLATEIYTIRAITISPGRQRFRLKPNSTMSTE